MSAYQVSFLILPKKCVSLGLRMPAEVLDHPVTAYRSFELPSNYADVLASILPAKKSWADDQELWGDEKADDFSIWWNQDRVESIELRLDVRKLDDHLLAEFLDLAEAWGGVLVERRHGTVCLMSVQELRILISGHAHNRAVKDPTVWLPFLADEVKLSSACRNPGDN